MAMIKAISCEPGFCQSSYNKLKLLKKFFIWFDIGFLVKLSMIPMNLGLKMDQNLGYIHIFVILFMNEI